jgi:hypothetical protein
MQQMEKQKGVASKKSSKQPLPKNLLSDRGTVEVSEIKNSKRELNYMENEYMRLANRMEEVADPNYAIQLTERIMAIEDKIKKGRKGKKSMEVSQIHREKKMHKAIELGEPYLQREIEKYKADMMVLQIKVSDANMKIDKNANMLAAFYAKKNNLSSSLKELEKTADHMGISNGTNKDTDVLKVQEKKLKLKQENLMREVKMVKTKGNIVKNEFNTKTNDLNTAISSLSNKIEKKNEYEFV